MAGIRAGCAPVADPGSLLGDEFTMFDLRSLYEPMFAFENPKYTFRRTMLRVLDATGERGVLNGGRPAQWFRRSEGMRWMGDVRGERLGGRG